MISSGDGGTILADLKPEQIQILLNVINPEKSFNDRMTKVSR